MSNRVAGRAGAVVLTLLILAAQVLFAAGPRAHAQTLNQGPDRLRLDIDTITPRVVRAGTKALTIVGSLTNIGDRRITNLIARIEIGDRLSTEAEARAALQGPLPAYRSASPFVPIVQALRPGESATLRLRVPLDGSAKGLAVPRPGVYPLLVNVNGTPDFGGPARLVAFNLLLPVLSAGGAPGSGGSPGRPTGLTVLWPITTTRPPVVRNIYGQPLVLADDTLADSLAPGGRLHSLVSTASSAMDRGRISSALCFAIDPALLGTVRAMTDGYQVRTNHGLVDGAGVRAAKQWLSALRSLVEGRCVIQLPYADADLNSLPRIGSSGKGSARLMPLAVDGAEIIKNMLGVKPLKGVLWPATGLSQQAAASAAAAGVSTVVTSRSRLPVGSTGAAGTTAVRISGTGLRAQAYDPLLHNALGNDGAMADVAVQNGLGALVFRIRQQRDSGAAPILLAPPHRWSAPGGELGIFLRTLGEFADAGMIEPVPLQESLAESPDDTSTPDGSGFVEATNTLSGQALRTLSEVDSTATALASAMEVDATSLVQPQALVRPLREAVLRASSTAWRGNPARRSAAVQAATAQVDAITSQVSITPPPQPIALASEDSPLPVYISNNLPVTITVQISLLNSPGLRPQKIQYQTIPANSSRNRNINIEPLRAGHITVGVKLSTPSGVQLGDVVRFELVSTEYGTITLIVTATAAGALVLLSGRRIYRRVRTRRASS